MVIIDSYLCVMQSSEA